MKSIFLLLVMIIFFKNAMASTWVGNGGSAGDLELQIALNLNKDVYESIKTKEAFNTDLCTCPAEFKDRKICQPLQDLNKEQILFCQKFLHDNAADIFQLINSKQINFNWTSDKINVRENNQIRSVEAVTNSSIYPYSITIQKENFITRDALDRSFIIAHELFHLTKFENKYLSDEGEIGPFKGISGGRDFINAMASTIAVQTRDQDTFGKYQEILNRSQLYKNHWISLGIDLRDQKSDSNNYGINNLSYTVFEYRYQPSTWGAYINFAGTKKEKTILTQTKGIEERKVVGIGVSTRLMPFDNPLDYWGQSYALIKVGIEQSTNSYELSDSFVSTSDTSRSIYPTISCNYFMPLESDLWFSIGVGYSAPSVKYDQINLNYKNQVLGLNIGASYAF